MKTYETLALIVICDRLGLNVNTMVFPDFVTEYFYFIGEASLVCWVGVSCGGNYMVGAVQEKDQSLKNHSGEH